jgi:hypothetical protein
MLTLLIALNLSVATGFHVHCQPLPPYIGGQALIRTREIILSPDTCAGFYGPPMDKVDSLLTLGHETAHLHGILNERGADCVAESEAPWLARRLHLTFHKKWLKRYGTVC